MTLTNEQVSPMEGLCAKLTDEIQTLHNHLDKAGQPHPSFDRNTPAVVLPDEPHATAEAARERVMDYALQIFQLAAGPSEYLANLQTGYHYISVLQWLCHFNIFELVPLDGSISYTDLAEHASVPVPRLKNIVRMGMTNALFVEPSPQQVAHSATSAWIRSNQNVRDWAAFMCNVSAPTTAAMTQAHTRWPGSLSRENTAYNVAFDTDLPFFDHLAQDPERHKQFAGYMKNVTASRGTHLRHLVNGYDWEGLAQAQVVDIGGSTGHVSIALARAYPKLTFTVQDLPEVVSGGETHLESLSDGPELSSRIAFQPHSFFNEQSIAGADVYLLRMILHDWGFDDAVRILSRLVPVLKEGARILVMDTIMPDPGSIPASRERLLRVRDLAMMQTFNSQERAMEDWRAVFGAVDSRLKLVRVVQPAGSVLSLMELGLE